MVVITLHTLRAVIQSYYKLKVIKDTQHECIIIRLPVMSLRQTCNVQIGVKINYGRSV